MLDVDTYKGFVLVGIYYNVIIHKKVLQLIYNTIKYKPVYGNSLIIAGMHDFQNLLVLTKGARKLRLNLKSCPSILNLIFPRNG